MSAAPILTGLNKGGIAIVLALRNTLANLITEIHIIANGRLKIGDYGRLEMGEKDMWKI
uniref:Mechanosensitive ion channel n=1 Tax=candidate division WOR-3 bacterium TaxID=2052148 RepID=A0A7C2K4N8_UNCW3